MSNYTAPADLLQGHTILVTGAGSGLGEAAARSFARHGATVILLGRTQKKLEAVYDAIVADQAPEPVIQPLDLARATQADFEKIATALGTQFGRLDGILHSAAELGNLTPAHQYDLDTWTRVFQVNLHAPYLLTRACLPWLLQAPMASVIFTSADCARHGRAYWGAYAAAGAALENLAQVWADELTTNTTVRFNTLDPGAVRTPLRTRAYPAEDARRLPPPADVMATYLYLMGRDSHKLTGQALSAQ